MTRSRFAFAAPARWLCCCVFLSTAAWGQARIVLAGSGSSVAGPILGIWEQAFNRQHDAVQVAYVVTSSGEGILQIAQLRGDFAIGEIPLTGEQMRNPQVPLMEIPIAVVALVPIYNLPGGGQLRFTGELLAQIYLGRVANWNDSRIAVLNPTVLLPSLPIVTVQRPEGSGTRHIFGEYLMRSSREFRSWMQASEHPEWGTIITAKSKDMAEKVSRTPGAIGFVERSFAVSYGVAYGSLQNRAGKYVAASAASIRAASTAGQKSIAGDPLAPLISAEGEDSYPLVGFAWIYVPASGSAVERREALKKFLAWALRDGQTLMGEHDYFPLPEALAARVRAKVESSFP